MTFVHVVEENFIFEKFASIISFTILEKFSKFSLRNQPAKVNEIQWQQTETEEACDKEHAKPKEPAKASISDTFIGDKRLFLLVLPRIGLTNGHTSVHGPGKHDNQEHVSAVIQKNSGKPEQTMAALTALHVLHQYEVDKVESAVDHLNGHKAFVELPMLVGVRIVRVFHCIIPQQEEETIPKHALFHDGNEQILAIFF